MTRSTEIAPPVTSAQPRSRSLTCRGFTFLAAGVFATLEEAQRALCPPTREVLPQPAEQAVYDELYPIYRALYFGMGVPESVPVAMGGVLPDLRRIAARVRARG